MARPNFNLLLLVLVAAAMTTPALLLLEDSIDEHRSVKGLYSYFQKWLRCILGEVPGGAWIPILGLLSNVILRIFKRHRKKAKITAKISYEEDRAQKQQGDKARGVRWDINIAWQEDSLYDEKQPEEIEGKPVP